MNSTITSNPKQAVKTLQLIHLVFLIGQVAFLSVVLLLGGLKSSATATEPISVFQIIAPILAIGGFVAGNFLFKQMLKQARITTILLEKLKQYQTASLIKFALLEGPCLFSIVCYLLTYDIFFAGLSLMLILVFLLERPSAGKIIRDLELTPKEKSEITE